MQVTSDYFSNFTCFSPLCIALCIDNFLYVSFIHAFMHYTLLGNFSENPSPYFLWVCAHVLKIFNHSSSQLLSHKCITLIPRLFHNIHKVIHKQNTLSCLPFASLSTKETSLFCEFILCTKRRKPLSFLAFLIV